MSDDLEHSPMQSIDQLSEDEDEEMEEPASKVTHLDSIQTIGEAYRDGSLKHRLPESKEPVFQPNPLLLDRVSLYQGDITKLGVDAIVNAANRSLLGGGGVDGAIHSAAGPKLLDECRTLNGCETGGSKITKGYDLPARHIIHTVGPIYTKDKLVQEEKAKQLTSCYETSLELAAENNIRHIAFPSISTGLYNYPIDAATRIALITTRKFLESEQGSKIENVIFVVWSDRDRDVFRLLIPEVFPPGGEESQDRADSSVAEVEID